jgi:hypothetical protein
MDRFSFSIDTFWLVGSEKYESMVGGLSHILWKINMFETTSQNNY